jgi:hypothetical protein
MNRTFASSALSTPDPGEGRENRSIESRAIR